jgi:hypothetical protein
MMSVTRSGVVAIAQTEVRCLGVNQLNHMAISEELESTRQ